MPQETMPPRRTFLGKRPSPPPAKPDGVKGRKPGCAFVLLTMADQSDDNPLDLEVILGGHNNRFHFRVGGM